MKQKVAIWLAVTLPTWGLLFFFLPFKPVATSAESNLPWLVCTLSAGVLFGYAMADRLACAGVRGDVRRPRSDSFEAQYSG